MSDASDSFWDAASSQAVDELTEQMMAGLSNSGHSDCGVNTVSALEVLDEVEVALRPHEPEMYDVWDKD